MEPVEATESAEAVTALTVFAGANIEDVIQGLSLLLLEVQVGQLRRQQHRKATLMHLIYSIVHVWRNLKEYSRVEYIVLSKYKECMGPLVCYEWGQYEMIYILILYCIFIFAKKKKRNPRIISKYILVPLVPLPTNKEMRKKNHNSSYQNKLWWEKHFCGFDSILPAQ